MARLLALDWDNNEFYLVSANVGRGKVKLERAVSWREEEAFKPANAEQFGVRLRDQLKKAGIAAAPLIVGLGRDKVVVKEVRYPQVPENVEAAVVRNQITKDLTESPDEVFLDYAPLAEPGRQGERRALSLVVRRDMVQGLQTVSRAAGLKLLAVTARPFGIAACFKHLAGTTPQVPAPPAADAVAGILTVTGTWAEFCAVRGRQLLFARSLAVGDGLLGEVRRNLAAYAGQPQMTFPRDAMQALYVSGNGENAVLREKLQETLGIPVYGLDPFAKEERVDVEPGNRAGYAGAVGLLHLWAVDQATPVNFVKPRESKQTADPGKRRVAIYGVVAALVLGCLVYAGYKVVDLKKEKLAEALKEKVDVEKKLKELEPEKKYLEALKEWRRGAIPWLDELYDLAALAPYEKGNGFRIRQIMVGPLPSKAGVKDKFTTRMTIAGVIDGAKADKVKEWMHAINNNGHSTCTFTMQKTDQKNGMEQFTLQVDMAYQLPANYVARLVLPPRVGDGLLIHDDEVDN